MFGLIGLTIAQCRLWTSQSKIHWCPRGIGTIHHPATKQPSGLSRMRSVDFNQVPRGMPASREDNRMLSRLFTTGSSRMEEALR